MAENSIWQCHVSIYIYRHTYTSYKYTYMHINNNALLMHKLLFLKNQLHYFMYIYTLHSLICMGPSGLFLKRLTKLILGH